MRCKGRGGERGKEGGRGQKEEEEGEGGGELFPLPLFMTSCSFFSFKELVLLAKKIPHLLGRKKICHLATFSLIFHKGEPFQLLWGFSVMG